MGDAKLRKKRQGVPVTDKMLHLFAKTLLKSFEQQSSRRINAFFNVLCTISQMFRSHQNLKIIVVTLLSALLLFQATGWFVATAVLQWQAKAAAYAALRRPETTLESVRVAAADLLAMRIGKNEIRYKGRLYDIKGQVVNGDSIMLVLYCDLEEEAVLSLFASGGGSDDVHSIPLKNWLAEWLSAAFLTPPPIEGMFDCSYRLYTPAFPCPLLLAQHTPGLLSPPPEL